MIDTKALRSRILDLAIQGKLTEQLESDGTAEELYQQIQAEKQALIKKGKIKKEKPLPEISADEIPFEIPSNWRWCRLITLYNFIDYRGATPNKISEGVPFITAKNVRQGYIDYSIKEYISNEDYTKRQSRGISHKGDLLFTTEAPMGYAAIADLDKFSAGQRLITLQQYTESPLLDNRYYMFLILSNFFKKQLDEKCSGTTVKGIKADRLKQFIISLPPLTEQKRIAQKVEEIFRVLDTIDEAQEKYSADSQILKAKLITAGIQGKLTKQLESDGTAHELYQQIQEEKQKLIKEGKIKKEKPLPPISPDEIPFEIPQNWMWVRLGEVSINVQYGSSKKSSPEGKIPVIRMGNLQNGRIIYDKLVYTSDDEEIERYQLEYNDLLFNRTNSLEIVGKTAIYKAEMPAIYAGYLVRITPLIDSDYLNFVMQSQYYWKYCESVRSDSIGQSNINAEKLKNFPVLMPPLAEQKRIADVLERVLGVVE